MEVERGEGPRSLGKTCRRPVLPAMLHLTCLSGSLSNRFNRVTDTSPRLFPRGGSEFPRTGDVGAPHCASVSCPPQTPHAAWTPTPSRALRPTRPRTFSSQASWRPSPVSPGHPSRPPLGGTPPPHL